MAIRERNGAPSTGYNVVTLLSNDGPCEFDVDLTGLAAVNTVYTVTPLGTSADAARIQAGGTAMAAVGGRLILGAGTYTVTDDVTIASNVVVEFMPGAVLDISTGITVAINGRVVDNGVKVTGLGTAKWHARTIASFWLVGDSLGVGSGAAYVGGWRTATEAWLRRFRADFDFVGDRMVLATTSAATGLAWHSCVSGETIGNATSALATRLAQCTTTTPDAVVAALGTNDIVGGSSAATMQTAWQTYEAAVFAALPNATIFVVAPPIFVAGTSVGGNLATWNAVRTTYVAWLAARCAADTRLVYIDPSTSPGLVAADFQDDGVHYNRTGNAAVGAAIGAAIDAWLGPVKAGALPIPRLFRQRQFAGSVLVDAAGDVRTATGAGCDIPTTGHYAVAIDLYPTALAAGPLAVLAIGPRSANPNMWLCIRQLANALDLGGYSGSGTWVTSGTASAEDRCLVLNKWHRIVAIIHRGNGTANSGSAGL
ncbi:MAG: SGNH/GDSL hydrolase family protein, partial [Giesbergeria sp.]